MSNLEEVQSIVQSELEQIEKQELAVQALAAELQQDPRYEQLLTAQKKFNEFSNGVWKKVEQTMIENSIKSIETDKMKLTIVELTNFNIDLDMLPKKYTKVSANTTLINSEYKLTGNLVKGTSLKPSTLYLKKTPKKDA